MAKKRKKFFFVKTIEIVIRLCTVLKFLFFSGGFEGRPILWVFSTIFSIETIYISPKLRENGIIFKTENKKKNSTQCIILSLFLLFSKKFFFFRSKNFMNLYSKKFYILNIKKKKKIMVK